MFGGSRSVRRSSKHTNGTAQRDGGSSDPLGAGGSARGVISRAREEAMVGKLSAPMRRASLNENVGGKENSGGGGGDWRAQQELLQKEIKMWPGDSKMNSLMPVQNYY
jgi:hypothetical protein